MKNFRFGTRERIIAIALGALVFIAIIHFLLYRPKSVQLTDVNKEYSAALEKYDENASKNLPPNEMKILQSDIKELDDLLQVSIEKFQIGKEKDIVGGGPFFMKILDDIKTLEKNTNKPKISVLAGWTITDDIPGLEPARIPDYLDQLKQKKAILSMPNIPDDLKDNFTSQYKEWLQKLGYNQVEMDKLNAFIAWLKKVRMYYYIKNHKGASDIKDAELYSLLDITNYDAEFMKVGLFFLTRTKDLINLAIQAQVDTVSDVKLLGRKDVRPAVKETPPPTATPATGLGGGYNFVEGGPFRGGPMAAEGGRGGIFPGLFGRGLGVATPTPTPAEPASAISIPIELVISGDNLSITKFLYAVTHSPMLMDIREFEITFQDEGKLIARVDVNCYRDVKSIDDLLKQKTAKAVPTAKPATK